MRVVLDINLAASARISAKKEHPAADTAIQSGFSNQAAGFEPVKAPSTRLKTAFTCLPGAFKPLKPVFTPSKPPDKHLYGAFKRLLGAFTPLKPAFTPLKPPDKHLHGAFKALKLASKCLPGEFQRLKTAFIHPQYLTQQEKTHFFRRNAHGLQTKNLEGNC
jgi:hypothetical protein